MFPPAQLFCLPANLCLSLFAYSGKAKNHITANPNKLKCHPDSQAMQADKALFKPENSHIQLDYRIFYQLRKVILSIKISGVFLRMPGPAFFHLSGLMHNRLFRNIVGCHNYCIHYNLNLAIANVNQYYLLAYFTYISPGYNHFRFFSKQMKKRPGTGQDYGQNSS